MSNVTPLISSICVTSNRPLLLQRALACFERQGYPNKEIVISYPVSDLLTRDIVNQIESISDIRIVKIERPGEENLGTARNHAVEAANGEYVCIWDDDDWYNHDRLERQYNAIKNTVFKACVLMNVLLYDYESKEGFHSSYRHWEGTLLCERETLLKGLYLDKEKGEDTALIYFLSSNNVLFHIMDAAHLYIYIYHGNNTWGESHFNSYFLQGQLLDKKVSEKIEGLTNLEYYHLKMVD